MSLFIDTSAFYALLVASEAQHKAVASAFRGATAKNRRLFTTNYVTVETAALLQHRIGLDAVRDFELRILPLVTVQWVDEAMHRRAVDRLFRTDKRRLSLVDVVSFLVMEEGGIADVLGLDSDFVAEGFRLLP